MSEDLILDFKYHIIDVNGNQKDFKIQVDAKTLSIIPKETEDLPEWSLLEFKQCPNCSLNSEEVKYCPVAKNLFPIMEFFKDSVSFEDSVFVLETKNRNYSKHTSLQQGVSAMIGIIMATSGCPILSKLKPMVRFHLPFASPQETLYRAMSMYLVQQYFKNKKGEEPDWELEGLIKIYEKVHDVNLAFFKRLSYLKGKDANVNSLIILDNFANYVNFSIDRSKLSSIEELFEESL
ncbi:MAG: hypothetical protein K9N09_02180 [Candidatus Cloacimonetes bacterium]|nr:hypothetical protein [Candidatus Cloacimonadota bacterium]MCF7813393.1 hypothetical protein [Candidatus Cloacimonadota bacterium]MCF7867482.1 hypothetical protein [Candidatus Cloacimonadota bacterium]MCF7883015.1 hypothetical protein [Candidatus Cloacimonadota bacterium]